jgi:hypothetical protein
MRLYSLLLVLQLGVKSALGYTWLGEEKACTGKQQGAEAGHHVTGFTAADFPGSGPKTAWVDCPKNYVLLRTLLQQRCDACCWLKLGPGSSAALSQ